MAKIDRKLKVFEIGCGQGDVTTIFCYLGFHSVCSFEKVPQLAENAKRRIENLFDRKDIIIQEEYPNPKYGLCDVLVLVNCAYKDLADSKQSYKELMMNYYSSAGEPKYFIMEAIDSSYTKEDDEFPEYIRLSRVDVEEMFPIAKIQSWPTYVYPQNLKSKTLYLIEKK